MAIHEVRINAKDSYEWDSINKQIGRGTSLTMENRLYFSKPSNQTFGNGASEYYYHPQVSRYMILEFDNPYPRKKFYQHYPNGEKYVAPKIYTYLESAYESITADGKDLYTSSMMMGGAGSQGWIYRYTGAGCDYRTNNDHLFDANDPNPRVDKFIPCYVGERYIETFGGNAGNGSLIPIGENDPQAAKAIRINEDYLNPPKPPPKYISAGYYYNFLAGVAPNNFVPRQTYDMNFYEYFYQRKQVKFPKLVGSTISLAPHLSGTNGNLKSSIDFHTRLTFGGHQSGNPPYMIAKFEDVVPYVAGASPQYGFVNEKEPVHFSWSMGYEDDSTIEIKPTLAYSEFQWRNANAVSIQTIHIPNPQAGNNVNFTLPANALPNGVIQWRVRVVTDDTISSEWSAWYELTTVDAIHYAPTSLSPTGVTLDGGKQTVFSWITHSPIGTPQRAYEVEITYNLGGSWERASGKVISGQWSFTASPDSFRSGKIGWRVRTYNSDDEPSPWSDVLYYTNKNAPKTPIWIRVEQEKARPKASWSSVEQVAFHFEILQGQKKIYEEKTFGTALEIKVPIYLEEGSYTFRIRIQNNTKLWSEWAAMAVAIFFPKRISVRLEGESQQDAIMLRWETEVEIL